MLLLHPFKLVPVLFQHGCFHLKSGCKREQCFALLHLVFFVTGKSTTVDHVVEGDVGDLLQAAGGHVQADRPVQEEGAQLEEGVEGEGRHVRFAPTVAPLLNIFLKLHPSKKRNYQ